MKPPYIPLCPVVDEDTNLQCELEDGHEGPHEVTIRWEDDEAGE